MLIFGQFFNLRVWVCVQCRFRFVFCSSRAILLWLVLSTHYFLPWNCCSWDLFCLCTIIWKGCFCSLIASTPQPKYRTEALWHSWGLHKNGTKVLLCRRLAWLNYYICFQGLIVNALIKSYFVLTITSWSKTIHRWKELVLLTEHSSVTSVYLAWAGYPYCMLEFLKMGRLWGMWPTLIQPKPMTGQGENITPKRLITAGIKLNPVHTWILSMSWKKTILNGRDYLVRRMGEKGLGVRHTTSFLNYERLVRIQGHSVHPNFRFVGNF